MVSQTGIQGYQFVAERTATVVAALRVCENPLERASWSTNLYWLRREALLLAIFGGFGLFVLPALVFLVGQQLLGPYRPEGGMGTFYGDLYGHLASGSPWPWLLVTGPWLTIQLLRLLWLPISRGTRRVPDAVEQNAPEQRAEPYI